jgi:hypothetical protein
MTPRTDRIKVEIGNGVETCARCSFRFHELIKIDPRVAFSFVFSFLHHTYSSSYK